MSANKLNSTKHGIRIQLMKMAALDLSSKGSPLRGDGGLLDDIPDRVTKAPLYSASHGLTSNSRKRRGLSSEPSHTENDCSSVSSDGHDTDGSTNTSVKPINITPMFQHQPAGSPSDIPAGPGSGGTIPGDLHMAQTPRDTSTPNSVTSTPNLSTTPTTPSMTGIHNRPFKMYPFEGNPCMPNMYSQLAAAMSSGGMYNYPAAAAAAAVAAAASANQNPVSSATMNPLTSLNMSAGMGGVFDSSMSLSSPIGQYLHQRKRRMEHRNTSASTTVSSSNNDDPIFSMASSMDTSISSHGIYSNPDSANGKRHFSSSDLHDHEPPSKKPMEENGENKDDSYWERRRKNNEAAKRSRDSRRAKEEEIAMRAAFLEQENLKLRAQVAILKNETAKLHYMLYNRM